MIGLRRYARDLRLPAKLGDDVLIVPEAGELLDLIGRHLALSGRPGPSGAEVHFARWKPGVSVTAGVHVRFDDGESRFVTYKRYTGPKAEAIAARGAPEVHADIEDDRLERSVTLTDRATCLWTFPVDRVLPGLLRLCNKRRTSRMLQELGLYPGWKMRPGPSTITPLRFKPERRCVALLDLRLRQGKDQPRIKRKLMARVLSPAAAESASVARRRWQEVAPPRLAPRLLAHQERTGTLFEEWLDIEPVAAPLDQAAQAGVALAKLQTVALNDAACAPNLALPDFGELFEIESSLAERFRALLRWLNASQRTVKATWVHGDFHPDQLARRVDDGRSVLLDLDELGVGAPSSDLGSWIADHLAFNRIASWSDASDAILGGYQQLAEPPPLPELQTAVVQHLVARAAAAIRRLEATALADAQELLQRASSIAEP